MAASMSRWEPASILQYFRIWRGFMWALAKMPSLRKRSCWIERARVTRSRMDEDASAGVSSAISRNLMAGTSMWMSMRSSSGPDIA